MISSGISRYHKQYSHPLYWIPTFWIMNFLHPKNISISSYFMRLKPSNKIDYWFKRYNYWLRVSPMQTSVAELIFWLLKDWLSRSPHNSLRFFSLFSYFLIKEFCMLTHKMVFSSHNLNLSTESRDLTARIFNFEKCTLHTEWHHKQQFQRDICNHHNG